MAGTVMRKCQWCRSACTLLPGTGVFGVVSVCLTCDTAPATAPGNRLHAGPPNLPNAENGWFLPPAG